MPGDRDKHRQYCLIVVGMAWGFAFLFWWTGVSPVMGFALLTLGAFFTLFGLGDTNGFVVARNRDGQKVEDSTEE